MARLKATSTLLLSFLSQASALEYQLVQEYKPSNIFEEFRFYDGPDPTGGFVQYVSLEVAATSQLISNASDLIYIGVDSTNVYTPGGLGRPSVRLESKSTFTEGLFVINLTHIPVGCGTWPAFWTTGLSDWPADGEIDIIENVNDARTNNAAIHATGNCSVNSTTAQTGVWKSTDCNIEHDGNQGCGTAFTEPFNYGAEFNANGGGVYAMEWTSELIRIWFFPLNKVPSSLTDGEIPDTDTFGPPSASFSGPCSRSFGEKFFNHSIVIDTTFCGGWAGGTFGMGSSSCPLKEGLSRLDSCIDFVANNPEAFTEAYWGINSIKVWEKVPSFTVPSLQTPLVQPPFDTADVEPVPFPEPIEVYFPPLTSGVLASGGNDEAESGVLEEPAATPEPLGASPLTGEVLTVGDDVDEGTTEEEEDDSTDVVTDGITNILDDDSISDDFEDITDEIAKIEPSVIDDTVSPDILGIEPNARSSSESSAVISGVITADPLDVFSGTKPSAHVLPDAWDTEGEVRFPPELSLPRPTPRPIVFHPKNANTGIVPPHGKPSALDVLKLDSLQLEISKINVPELTTPGLDIPTAPSPGFAPSESSNPLTTNGNPGTAPPSIVNPVFELSPNQPVTTLDTKDTIQAVTDLLGLLDENSEDQILDLLLPVGETDPFKELLGDKLGFSELDDLSNRRRRSVSRRENQRGKPLTWSSVASTFSADTMIKLDGIIRIVANLDGQGVGQATTNIYDSLNSDDVIPLKRKIDSIITADKKTLTEFLTGDGEIFNDISSLISLIVLRDGSTKAGEVQAGDLQDVMNSANRYALSANDETLENFMEILQDSATTIYNLYRWNSWSVKTLRTRRSLSNWTTEDKVALAQNVNGLCPSPILIGIPFPSPNDLAVDLLDPATTLEIAVTTFQRKLQAYFDTTVQGCWAKVNQWLAWRQLLRQTGTATIQPFPLPKLPPRRMRKRQKSDTSSSSGAQTLLEQQIYALCPKPNMFSVDALVTDLQDARTPLEADIGRFQNRLWAYMAKLQACSDKIRQFAPRLKNLVDASPEPLFHTTDGLVKRQDLSNLAGLSAIDILNLLTELGQTGASYASLPADQQKAIYEAIVAALAAGDPDIGPEERDRLEDLALVLTNALPRVGKNVGYEHGGGDDDGDTPEDGEDDGGGDENGEGDVEHGEDDLDNDGGDDDVDDVEDDQGPDDGLDEEPGDNLDSNTPPFRSRMLKRQSADDNGVIPDADAPAELDSILGEHGTLDPFGMLGPQISTAEEPTEGPTTQQDDPLSWDLPSSSIDEASPEVSQVVDALGELDPWGQLGPRVAGDTGRGVADGATEEYLGKLRDVDADQEAEKYLGNPKDVYDFVEEYFPDGMVGGLL